MKIEVNNLTDGVITISDGTSQYSVTQGIHNVPIVSTNLNLTRSDDSTFSVGVVEQGRLYVSNDSYTLENPDNLIEFFGMGMSLGIVIMMTALALRAVKTLGYHSQDI